MYEDIFESVGWWILKISNNLFHLTRNTVKKVLDKEKSNS